MPGARSPSARDRIHAGQQALDLPSVETGEPGAPAIKDTLLTASAGDILICHDGGGNRAQTVTALKAVLPQLRAEGLRFVAL